MNNPNSTYSEKHSNAFSTASFVVGIIGIATGCCVYTGIICGALAIIFALLSKGSGYTINPKSKIGLTLGIVSIVLGIVIFIAILAFTIASFGNFENFLMEYSDILNELDTAYPYSL